VPTRGVDPEGEERLDQGDIRVLSLAVGGASKHRSSSGLT